MQSERATDTYNDVENRKTEKDREKQTATE